MSTERIFVFESQYERLCSALRDAWATVDNKQRKILFSETSTKHVDGLIDDAVTKGIKPILDQDQSQDGGISPQIYGPATPDMGIYLQETFGPVSVIITIPDEGRTNDQVIDEMVSLANDSEYGLSASVWDQEIRARAVAAKLQSGAVHVNSPVSSIAT